MREGVPPGLEGRGLAARFWRVERRYRALIGGSHGCLHRGRDVFQDELIQFGDSGISRDGNCVRIATGRAVGFAAGEIGSDAA